MFKSVIKAPIVRAGDHRTQGDGNDVQKHVLCLATTTAWIAQSGKTTQHRKHALGHGSFALCLATSPEKSSAHNSRRRAFLTLSTTIEKTKGCGNNLWVYDWALVPQANPGKFGGSTFLFASTDWPWFAQFTKMLKWDALALFVIRVLHPSQFPRAPIDE